MAPTAAFDAADDRHTVAIADKPDRGMFRSGPSAHVQVGYRRHHRFCEAWGGSQAQEQGCGTGKLGAHGEPPEEELVSKTHVSPDLFRSAVGQLLSFGTKTPWGMRRNARRSQRVQLDQR